MVVVSVVSHGQNALVQPLVEQLLQCADVHRVILTCNVPDAPTFEPGPRLDVIENSTPKGFGANHNSAFRHARDMFAEAPLFCILNPDISLDGNPFPILSEDLQSQEVGLAAPRILSPSGQIEDSARTFPTISGLFLKLLGFKPKDYFDLEGPLIHPDWVAGMFMLVTAKTFDEMGGFDEGFHLYYEDVDLCDRLRRASKRIVCDTRVTVVHDARRESHRNIRYFKWHVISMSRFFVKQLLQPRAYCASGGKRI